jgi:hypothetical protein
MSFLKKIGSIFSSSPSNSNRILNLYVQCSRCGEKLQARVDTWNELTPDFDGNSDDPASYFCRKVLVGENLCFQPVELSLTFDKKRVLTNQEINGGKYIEQAEFDQQS